MQNWNKCQNSYVNWFNTPVNSVIWTLSWWMKSVRFGEKWLDAYILCTGDTQLRWEDTCYLGTVLQTFSNLLITVSMWAFLSPAGAVGLGTGDIATPPVRLSVRPSVCPSVTFSFRTVTQKRMAVFSRNFAGTCTKSWGCAV